MHTAPAYHLPGIPLRICNFYAEAPEHIAAQARPTTGKWVMLKDFSVGIYVTSVPNYPTLYIVDLLTLESGRGRDKKFDTHGDPTRYVVADDSVLYSPTKQLLTQQGKINKMTFKSLDRYRIEPLHQEAVSCQLLSEYMEEHPDLFPDDFDPDVSVADLLDDDD